MSIPARSGLARAGASRSALDTGAGAAPSTFASLILIARDRILEALALIAPAAPLVAPQGIVGATTYGYQLVATNTKGHSSAGPMGQTMQAAAPLSPTAAVAVSWTPVLRATGYDVYRVVGGTTQGRIASVGAGVTTFTDTGQAGDGTTAPTYNTSGTLGQFWSDEELLAIMVLGAKDLWRAFIDLHQDHFFTVDVLHVWLPANAEWLSGVPGNVHRVLTLEPLEASTNVTFTPTEYKSSAFRAMRTRPPADPTSAPLEILYAVTGAGAPLGAPMIFTAPRVIVDLPIRLVYIPTLGSGFTLLDYNPVPGESDAALVAYTVAFALAKDREDRSPDPNWLAVYATEKTSCLTASTPRQEQVAPVVTGIFDAIYGPGLSGDAWDD